MFHTLALILADYFYSQLKSRQITPKKSIVKNQQKTKQK